jgi:PD-(D/E)XK nuclease superfamily
MIAQTELLNRTDSKPSQPKRTVQDLTQTVSASRLTLFHQCRLKFFFRYVQALKKPKDISLFVGSVVHLVLQTWNKARWRKVQIDAAGLKTQFEQHWSTHQEEETVVWQEGEEMPLKEYTWSLLDTYLKSTPINASEKVEGVEVPVEADLTKHGLPTLIGVLDLVREGGKIVDFKTTGQTPNSDRALHLHETQLSCYGVLYREATSKRESGFELHHLVKLKTPKLVVTAAPTMTEKQQTRLFKVMESYSEGVQRQDWVPNPNPMTCACCEYFNECRAWG